METALNDLRIKPFDFQAALDRAGLRPDGTPRSDRVGGNLAPAGVAAPAGDFRSAMTSALQSVSQSQLQTEGLQRELTLDNPRVSLEQTVLAMQKSQIGFQAVLQVRNRLAQAYTDIMNMQI
jgi:flagellar hook-basal body complex protein FliE